MAERITLTTDDGVIIAGDWVTAPTVLGAVVLFHAMPDTRKAWAAFQSELAKRNLASLAIDLRGHGDSVLTEDGDKIDYNSFSDEEHQSSIFDCLAAVQWVHGRGHDLQRIAVGGASIGATLAVRTLVEEPRLSGAVLLSPGNYRGMNVTEDAQSIGAHQALFVASSDEDTESYAPTRELNDSAPVDTKVFAPYKNAGHGMKLFDTDRALMTRMADWLSGIIQGT